MVLTISLKTPNHSSFVAKPLRTFEDDVADIYIRRTASMDLQEMLIPWKTNRFSTKW